MEELSTPHITRTVRQLLRLSSSIRTPDFALPIKFDTTACNMNLIILDLQGLFQKIYILLLC